AEAVRERLLELGRSGTQSGAPEQLGDARRLAAQRRVPVAAAGERGGAGAGPLQALEGRASPEAHGGHAGAAGDGGAEHGSAIESAAAPGLLGGNLVGRQVGDAHDRIRPLVVAGRISSMSKLRKTPRRFSVLPLPV